VRFEYSAGAAICSYRNGSRSFLFLMREDGKLDLPKGKIEKDESAEEAAIREIREESGLAVRLNTEFKYGVDYWYAFKGERVKKHVTMFLAEVDGSARVKISWEHKGYEWLDYKSAMEKLPYEQWKSLITAANEYMDKREQMETLNEEYAKIPDRNKGWSLSRRFVKGEGSLDAKVMFVGQAPGANEEKEGRPFIGISGRLLDRLIASAGLKRSSCYITSVVQFFPPRNRIPTDDEIALCKSFILAQIEIIKPRIVVLLGSVAAKTLVGADRIMKNHGACIKRGNVVYFLSLHPAAAVRLKKNVPVMERDFAKLKVLIKRISP
jgi:uracil-DNA glycosylase